MDREQSYIALCGQCLKILRKDTIDEETVNVSNLVNESVTNRRVRNSQSLSQVKCEVPLWASTEVILKNSIRGIINDTLGKRVRT